MSEIPDNMQKIKTFLKKTASKFLKGALIILALFTAIIILLGSMYDALMENFSEKVSNYVQERPVEYDVTDGSIVISEELIKELKQVLNDTGFDIDELNITDEHIKKMYAAEVVSQEINRGVPEEEGKYYGRVYVKKLTDTDTVEPMNYVASVEDFKKLGAEEILKSYSIEGDKLWLASINRTTDKEGNIISEEIAPISINYKNYISQYTMPFEFLIDLAAITRNIEFVMAITDKVLNETEIQIAVMQRETSTETTVNSTWTEVYEAYTQEITKTTDPNTGITTTTGGEKHYEEPKETPKEESKTEIETNITPTINVISAKTWIMDMKQSYSKVPDTKESDIPEDAEENIIEPSPLPDYSDTPIGEVQGVGTNTRTQTHRFERTYKKDEKKSVHIIEKTISYEKSGSVVQNDKAKEIVELLNTRYDVPGEGTKSAMGNLESGFDIFINMLRKSPRTEKLENIMRYIMYVATGDEDYGVTSLDLSMFEPGDFSSVLTSGGALVNYIKSWENDALWKYETGQTTTMPTKWMTTKDSKDYYIVYEDGSAGHNNVSYGIATFITSSKNAKTTHPIYGVGYYNWQTEFAEYGVDVTKFATGDLVEKEVANAVFAKVIATFESYVDSYLNKHGITLEKWQRDALVSVAYKHGNIGNFADAYTQYGDTEALRTAFKTSKGATPFASNTKRNESYWNLFHNGEYIGRNGDKITSGILDIAETIHAYMEENNYTYCVYFNNGYEECSSKNQCSLAKTFEKSKTSKKSCCATYVSWVLQEAGYLTEDEHKNSATKLRELLLNKGWIKITSVADLQPGDVLCYDGHIEIYAGDSKVYNAGSGPIIRADAPSKKTGISSMMFALRAPW